MSGWHAQEDIDELNARLDGDDERIDIDLEQLLDNIIVVLGVFAAVVGVVILLGIAGGAVTTYVRCRSCRGRIYVLSNRCATCGRLDNIWNAIAAWLRERRP